MAETSEMTAMQKDLELLRDINNAREAFKANSFLILTQAKEEGGVDLVKKIQDEVQLLDDAYYDVRDRLLDQIDGRYTQLATEAKSATKALKSDIESLESAKKVFEALEKAVTLIGRLLLAVGAVV